ncbi:MAG: transposase [Labedaea sp.]
MGRYRRRGRERLAEPLSDLKNRGVEDILLVACDRLTGLPEAITTLWPATVQLRMVHLVRAKPG